MLHVVGAWYLQVDSVDGDRALVRDTTTGTARWHKIRTEGDTQYIVHDDERYELAQED